MTKHRIISRMDAFACGALMLGLAACEAHEEHDAPRLQPRDGILSDDGEVVHPLQLAPPGNVGVTLSDPPGSSPDSREHLSALVMNVGEEPVHAEIAVVGIGLDGKQARRVVQSIELEPGHEAQIEVPIADLPMQTVGHAGVVRFEALVDHGDETRTSSWSQRVFVDFEEGYEHAWIYDADGAVVRNAELAEQGPSETLGRFLDESGSWREVPSSDATQGPVVFGPGGRVPKDVDPVPGPWGYGKVQVCALWLSSFVDNGMGEDIFGGSTLSASWASYASATIRKQGSWSPVWSGHLNANGCAPALALQKDDYELVLRSSFEGPQGQDIDVLYNYMVVDGPQGEYITDFKLSFGAAPPAFGTKKVTLLTNTMLPVANVSAVVSTALAHPDNGLPAGSYTFHTKKGCPGLPGSACANSSNVWLSSGPWGTGDDEWKYVVAHELGHSAQGKATGFPGFQSFDYDTVVDSEAACRCDHVTVSNQLHCLQSLEHTSKAQSEGFAQFFAAHAFNTLGSDCGFGYYKEFRKSVKFGDTTYGVVKSPPYEVNCAVAHQWRSNYCSDFEESGTELDWMTAYRALQQGGVTMDDLYAIYGQACGGNCSFANPQWDDLVSAAAAHYGSPTHPKAELFVQVGDQHDVQ